MARDFVLHIPGEVGGKGRPRTRIIYQGEFTPLLEEVQAIIARPRWQNELRRLFNGRPLATIYPDPDSAREELMIKGLALAAMRGRPLFEGPVELTVEVFHNHPPSWPRWKKEKAPEGFYRVGKPDVDNMVKLIGDAFNDTVWKDDAQIADLIVRRRFTEHPPSVAIRVLELVRELENDLFAAEA